MLTFRDVKCVFASSLWEMPAKFVDVSFSETAREIIWPRKQLSIKAILSVNAGNIRLYICFYVQGTLVYFRDHGPFNFGWMMIILNEVKQVLGVGARPFLDAFVSLIVRVAVCPWRTIRAGAGHVVPSETKPLYLQPEHGRSGGQQ